MSTSDKKDIKGILRFFIHKNMYTYIYIYIRSKYKKYKIKVVQLKNIDFKNQFSIQN